MFKKSFHPQFHLQDLEEMDVFFVFFCGVMRLGKVFCCQKKVSVEAGKEYWRLVSML